MAKYGMAINLNKCVGCGACGLACKTENNTEYKQGGRKFNWADFLTFTEGTFDQSDVSFKVFPVLCNHCSSAACVDACPVDPKAMYKTTDGITMHNDSRCIGCQACITACPYSSKNVDTDGVQYSVISYNPFGANTQVFYDDTSEIITNCTSSPADIATAAAITPPDKNDYTHTDYHAVRPVDVVEKCIFCDHRLQNGDNPHCVDSCPTGARVFGDLDDSQSDISQLITGGYTRLKDNSGVMLGIGETGTDPNVYYIGEFGTSTSRIENVKETVRTLQIYPNPASFTTYVEFELKTPSRISLSVFDITGRKVLNVFMNKQEKTGKHKVEINVADLKAGTYIVRLLTGRYAMTANMVISK